ncbi:ABC transporter permease [Ructibacterium gallinarum]|uniref:Sugar ABC transporter permease n=1 Tax=Ructibacterium gallinarum TaxID=2779355 RepID=A0A9D5R9B0_9FIRM|nr:ABC transporter permease subunit [Ructibacterium gallinarum]MBE5041261.1 sugar ABC transporter permease [Ructibacterium gallinarum]
MVGSIIAFKDYNFNDGIWGSQWVGFKHFQRFLGDPKFYIVVKNTLVLSIMRMCVSFPAPIILALLINEVRFKKYRNFIQTVSYLPHFVSWVVVYGIMYNFFSLSGLINQFTALFGMEPVNYLGSVDYFRPLFIGSAVWKEVGWGSIVYLAGLSNVNTDLYEAAVIDGASRWKRMWHISLPSIRPIISISFITSMGGILGVGMEQVMVMMNPVVMPVAEVLDYYIYRIGLLQFDTDSFSYSTAIGMFRALISILLILFTNWIAKHIDEDGTIW